MSKPQWALHYYSKFSEPQAISIDALKIIYQMIDFANAEVSSVSLQKQAWIAEKSSIIESKYIII